METLYEGDDPKEASAAVGRARGRLYVSVAGTEFNVQAYKGDMLFQMGHIQKAGMFYISVVSDDDGDIHVGFQLKY
jgi:hypothetical protein